MDLCELDLVTAMRSAFAFLEPTFIKADGFGKRDPAESSLLFTGA